MVSVLYPITRVGDDAVEWSDATWIGAASQEDLTERIVLDEAEKYANARILVWSGDQPRGFVQVPVREGVVDHIALADKVAALPDVTARPSVVNLPPVTVVVCTRDRPDQLRDMMNSLAQLDYPNFELLVVDNNPASGLTAPVVEEFDAVPARLATAVGKGLSIARNVALRAAQHDIVAFTDDDVIVEKSWLKNLVYGFARDAGVVCVCGMVPSAEVRTPAQSYFDRRVDWAQTCEPALFDLANPPEGEPLFPFRVAFYGTGANFAIRRDVAIALGGFDEGMGAGSPTAGGEDIDMFSRVLLAGHMLAREPSAVVWHCHRRTTEDLEHQIYTYGLGLGAWFTKLALQPRTAIMAARRVGPGLRHLRSVTVVEPDHTAAPEPALDGLHRTELRGVLTGPWALVKARFSGRSAAPLKLASNSLTRAFAFRSGQNWGDPGNSIASGRLAVAGGVLALCGLLGSIGVLPSVLRALLVGALVLAAPGCLILSWYVDRIPLAATTSLVPALSLAITMLTITIPLMAGFYEPRVFLLVLATACVVGSLLRCGGLARRAEAPS